MDREKNKSRHEQIADQLRKRIAGMRTGEKMPSERKLCLEFAISRMTANKIMNNLETEGLLRREHGSGSYVMRQSPEKPPVYFLLPCAEYLIYDCTYNLRLILYGAGLEADVLNRRISPVAVSDTNDPLDINRDKLEEIPPGSDVIICGWWFRETFGFLKQRGCRVVLYNALLQNQLDMVDGWCQIGVDDQQAVSETVKLLAVSGRKRIAMVYASSTGRNPMESGYRYGLEASGLPYDESLMMFAGNPGRLCAELPSASATFDAVIVACNEMGPYVLRLLSESPRRIPDDMAVVSYGDYGYLKDFSPQISAVSLPYVDIGRRALQLLDRKNFPAERILLNTSFIGRGSTGEQLRSVSAELKDSRERSFNL